MSRDKQFKVMSRLNSRFWRSASRLPNRFVAFLLRSWFLLNRSSRYSRAGFVLPTTVLLLLMVTLTVGALSVRSFSRVNQAIAYREQQVVDSFAAPAVDRAKAKLEYMFIKDQAIVDKRPPSSSDLMSAILANAGAGPGVDPYTLPDETQLDINGDGSEDPAWSFDSQGTTVVYSMLMSHEATDPITGNAIIDGDGNDLTLASNSDLEKANELVTRNAPISTQKSNINCPVSRLSGDGWQDAGSELQKNFQVDVLAITNADGPNRTVSAAEYQQVRSAPKGNKYGAYFRYDMEIFPGATFRWNGAMHSESNIIAGDNFKAYLVSSPNSCIFSEDSSEVTISESEDDNNDGQPDGFKGQLVAGLTRDNNFGASDVDFHTNAFQNLGGVDVATQAELDDDTDSVDEISSPDVTDVAVDPVAIFTEDESVNINDGTWDPVNPNNGSEYLGQRVRNLSDSTRPFLDDGYRADNRYGPKPRYNSIYDLDGNNIGTQITGNAALTDNNLATEEFGLDGYWERRAIAQGLRVVIGQRLELGNSFGWGADDPLYPPEAEFGADTDANGELDATGGDKQKGAAETKQQKSLRDNLAAVQGMVVYHYTEASGELPYMCMASTVHPGTQQTLINSRTFGQYDETGDWEINFLEGKGTNGWEFDFYSNFASSIGPADALGAALRNLAYFAGDPSGGAPSFTPLQDGFVHPYPYLSMWGDFSKLRRIFDTYTVNTAAQYNALSPADKSTLHSAACTLGMLAYNLQSLQDEYDAIPANGNASLNALGVQISNLMDGNVANGEIGEDPATNLCTTNLGAPGCPPTFYDPSYYSQFTKDEWINALENDGALGANLATAIARAEVIGTLQQVLRDRTMGFIPGGTSIGLPGTGTGYDASAGTFDYQGGGNPFAGATFDVGCDPTGFAVTGGNSDQAQLGLSVAFCSISEGPKYPALHYIFPPTDHDQIGSGTDYVQPYDDAVYGVDTEDEFFTEGGAASPYVVQVSGAGAITGGANQGADLFKAVDPDAIDLTPAATVADFKQPTDATGGLSSRDDLQTNTIDANGTIYELAFLDKAMMDGRELMNVRLLDLDIGKLTLDKPFDSNSVAWIPETDGIFYAAREDAVREDNIVRPSQATWATCRVFSNLVDNGQDCPMDVVPTASNQLGTFDPPLNSNNLISPKPVDMYADPDRRPYGFRLINGYTLNRSDDDKAAGLTFVTDNPAYIYGDFNLHQTKPGVDPATGTPTILEEFKGTDVLGTAFATEGDENTARRNFYDRIDLDDRFARGDADTWRPAEIFADAITILSNSFRDGWVEDAFINVTDGTVGSPAVESSYLNFNRPVMGTAKDPEVWQREDKKATEGETEATLLSTNGAVPILFDRNGVAYKSNPENNAASTYFAFPKEFSGAHISFYDLGNFSNRRQSNQMSPAATETRVNALLIAGIVPLREHQNYGGLHNFPRLLEYWPNKALIISGGFFQLNFSTHSTAPFDQDAWEPGTIPDRDDTVQQFYGAATRVWGYDVAFQYTSVAPIARRFVTLGRPRSEFYRELPLDDAYVQNLCTALNAQDNTITCQ